MLQQWSSSQSLPDASWTPFSSSLTTTVFSQRSMRRFGASPRRAAPKGQPSSLVQHRIENPYLHAGLLSAFVTHGAGSFGVNGCSYAMSSCGLLIFGSGWVRVFRCQICLEPATRPEPKPAPSNNSKPSDTTSPSSRSNRPDNQTPKSITAASPVVADDHVTNQGGHQRWSPNFRVS